MTVYSLQVMEDRLHLIKRAVAVKTQRFQKFLRFADPGSQMLWFVTVAADRHDPAAAFPVTFQNLDGGHCFCQSVALRRRIDFNPLPLRDDHLQNLLNPWSDPLKRINSRRIVALDQIQMSQYAVMLIFLNNLQQFLIVAFIVFLL